MRRAGLWLQCRRQDLDLSPWPRPLTNKGMMVESFALRRIRACRPRIGRRRKGPALDRIATTFGFALASTRTGMTFPIARCRQPPQQAKSRELRAIRPKALARAWKTAVSGSLEAQRRPPFPTPTQTDDLVTGRTRPPARQRCGKRRATLRRYGGALRPPFPTPAQRRSQKQLSRLCLASASALSPKKETRDVQKPA